MNIISQSSSTIQNDSYSRLHRHKNGMSIPSSLSYKYNLNADTVSFGAIKKTKLAPQQLYCANYFKAPLEKFNSSEDMTKWVEDKLENTLNIEQYECMDTMDTQERFSRLEEWKTFFKTDKKITKQPELALVIADAFTRDLYPDTRNFPPLFDKKAIETTIECLEKKISAHPKENINIKKMYVEILKHQTLNDVEKFGDGSGSRTHFWVRIPSESNDPENFQKNIKDLNILSSERWCTRGYFANEYLKKGDFYIYIENNAPELSVRLENKDIKEIRDRNHNSKIGLTYLNPLKYLLAKNKLDPSGAEIEELEHRQALVDFSKDLIQEDIKNKNYINILKLAGIKSTTLDDGTLEISHFCKPHKEYTFKDLGINENDMFKHISVITGDANFDGTQVTKLGSLKSIGGYTFLAGGKLDLDAILKVKRENRIFFD